MDSLELWVAAHAAMACDCQVDVRGNSHNPHTVIEMIKFMNDDGPGYCDFEKPPYREEVEAYIWSWGENPHEVADLDMFDSAPQEILEIWIGDIFSPPYVGEWVKDD